MNSCFSQKAKLERKKSEHNLQPIFDKILKNPNNSKEPWFELCKELSKENAKITRTIRSLMSQINDLNLEVEELALAVEDISEKAECMDDSLHLSEEEL